MRGERRSRQDYYKALFAELERSGLSLYAFARKKDLPYSTLVPWRRRLAGEAKASKAKKSKPKKKSKGPTAKAKTIGSVPKFLPVSVEGAGLALSSQAESCEVRLRNGHELRIPPGFDPVTLCALVKALDPASCSR